MTCSCSHPFRMCTVGLPKSCCLFSVFITLFSLIEFTFAYQLPPQQRIVNGEGVDGLAGFDGAPDGLACFVVAADRLACIVVAADGLAGVVLAVAVDGLSGFDGAPHGLSGFDCAADR